MGSRVRPATYGGASQVFRPDVPDSSATVGPQLARFSLTVEQKPPASWRSDALRSRRRNRWTGSLQRPPSECNSIRRVRI